jgi:hypothetical protein
MLPTHVALVPYNEDVDVSHKELLCVAAALQKQVIRDLGPLWGVAGIVSPFLKLEHVPPGYAPLAIVAAGLPFNYHGLHFATGGQPIALVAQSESWSLMASHELVELLCDPWGNRTTPGRSLGDEKKALTSSSAVVDGEEYEDQGQVEYLVEVCDPCQRATYTISGVLLSDFVTPQYYDPFQTDGARYSFTGRITATRQLLTGGYITWRTRRPSDAIWQAFAPMDDEDGMPEVVPTEELKIVKSTDVAPIFSREGVDSHPTTGLPYVPDRLSADQQPLKGAKEAYRLAGESAERYGATLRTDIERLLKPTSSREPILSLLEDLANNQTFREEFRQDPGAKLDRLKIAKPIGLPPSLDKLPSTQDYQAVLSWLKAGERFGPAFDQFDQAGLASWLCSLGGF